MSLASIFQIPQTPDDLSVWSFSHAAHHRDIIRVIFQKTQKHLDEYVLDPFDPVNPQNWPALHQTMHDQMNAALGIGGYNLIDPNWQDADALVSWSVLHAQEHYRVGSILGLG